ncbi:MAG: hypothetical protein JWM85_2093 [Acidimicrobiaceae bacterium]|nr:hypothetical protein [Acidimicrobiaceae bacterium]
MGFLDTILGRTKPAAPNLDRLFGLPGAAITLQSSEGVLPTLQAAVCFKPAVGQAFNEAEQELVDLIQLKEPGSAGPVAGNLKMEGTDQYGYRWVVVEAADFDTLVTQVHLVNSTLQEHGYGPQLLCSVFGFGPGGTDSATPKSASTYIVYLYKRGTFYPFVPEAGERRDNEAELRMKELLAEDLAIESDLDRWFPLWGLPLR